MAPLLFSPELQSELVQRVQQRTGRRVRDLEVELLLPDHRLFCRAGPRGRRVRDLEVELLPQGVVLHGHATSYHVKQLAQHGIRDVLPQVALHNAIVVEE